MPNYRKSVCYFCGEPSTSTEHAPPEMFFRGFPCDSITAPSCDDHNSHKSGDDQSIVSALIQSLNNAQIKNGSSNLPPEVQKAIETAKSSFNYTKKRVTNVDLFETSSLEGEFPKVAHFQGKVETWIRQLTAVLIWDTNKSFDGSIDWKKSFVRSPNYIPSNQPKPLDVEVIIENTNEWQKVEKLESNLDWTDGWSAHPRSYPLNIYRFYFTVLEPNDIVFKHRFYDSYNVFIMFSANEKIIKAIYERAASYKIKS